MGTGKVKLALVAALGWAPAAALGFYPDGYQDYTGMCTDASGQYMDSCQITMAGNDDTVLQSCVDLCVEPCIGVYMEASPYSFTECYLLFSDGVLTTEVATDFACEATHTGYSGTDRVLGATTPDHEPVGDMHCLAKIVHTKDIDGFAYMGPESCVDTVDAPYNKINRFDRCITEVTGTTAAAQRECAALCTGSCLGVFLEISWASLGKTYCKLLFSDGDLDGEHSFACNSVDTSYGGTGAVVASGIPYEEPWGEMQCYARDDQPTMSPSAEPTMSPSAMPSTTPTMTPSATPTTAPSTTPTASPSTSPSVEPTMSPSATPSTTPTTAPSTTPTASPSTSPSVEPTMSPSATPSTTPTTAPSTTPTASPSTSPSVEPTMSPSSTPSATPTTAPSTTPTASPSTSPTAEPTMSPSATPSATPTTAPSTTPTTAPSMTPPVYTFIGQGKCVDNLSRQFDYVYLVNPNTELYVCEDACTASPNCIGLYFHSGEGGFCFLQYSDGTLTMDEASVGTPVDDNDGQAPIGGFFSDSDYECYKKDTMAPTTTPTASPVIAVPSASPTAAPTPFGFCTDARVVLAFDVSASPDALEAQKDVAKALLDTLHIDPDYGVRAGLVMIGTAAQQTVTLVPSDGISKMENGKLPGKASFIGKQLTDYLDALSGAQGWTDLSTLLDHQVGGIAKDLDGLPENNPVIVLFTEGLLDNAPDGTREAMCEAREKLAIKRPDVTVACYQSSEAEDLSPLGYCVCDVAWLRGEKVKGETADEYALQMRNAVCEPVIKQVNPCLAITADKGLQDVERPDHCKRVKRNYRGEKTRKNDAEQALMRHHCFWDDEKEVCDALPRFANLYVAPKEGDCWGFNRRKCQKKDDTCLWGVIEDSNGVEVCYPDPDGGETSNKCSKLAKGKCKKKDTCEWKAGKSKGCYEKKEDSGGSVCEGLNKKKCKAATDTCEWGDYFDELKGKTKKGCLDKSTGGRDTVCDGLDKKECKQQPDDVCKWGRYLGSGLREDSKRCHAVDVAPTAAADPCASLTRRECRTAPDCVLFFADRGITCQTTP